jgi:hypothetical protein
MIVVISLPTFSSFLWKADAMHGVLFNLAATCAGKNIESRPANTKGVYFLLLLLLCYVPAKHLFQQHLNIHIID